MPSYKALQKIHLGGAEPPTHIDQNEIVMFDGSSLKRANGLEVKLQFPGALQGAIKAGWLVEAGSAQTSMKAKPAGIQVHVAQSSTPERAAVKSTTIQDEERNVGTIASVRPAGSPGTHVAARSGELSSAASLKVVRETDDDSGVIVSRFKTSAVASSVEIGKNDQAIVNKIDNAARVSVTRPEDQIVRKATATGDVQEAISGEELEELLPDAASSGRPTPAPVAPTISAEMVEVQRLYRKGELSVPKLLELLKLDPLKVRGAVPVKPGPTPSATAKPPAQSPPPAKPTSTEPAVKVSSGGSSVGGSEAGVKVGSIPSAAQKVPGVSVPWDLKEFWGTRVGKLKPYATNEAVLRELLAVEQPGVQKEIQKLLAKL